MVNVVQNRLAAERMQDGVMLKQIVRHAVFLKKIGDRTTIHAVKRLVLLDAERHKGKFRIAD